MYRVLIVDDEQWIRRWLVKTIPTLRSDVEIVDAFDNGQTALDVIINGQIDIVVSDIRMPIIDGLELLKLVHESKLKTKFILISGYDDFSYAKTAIKLGAIDYVLKPIEKDELKVALDNTILQIEDDKKIDNNPELIHSAIYKILRTFVIDKDESELSDIKSICIENNIKYNYIMLAVLQPSMVVQNKNYIKDALSSALNKRFENDMKFVILADSLNFFIFIFHEGDVDDMPLLIESLKRELENKDGKPISKIEFSPWFSEIESLTHHFNEINRKLEHKNCKEEKERKIESEKLDEIKSNLVKYISSHDIKSSTEYINYLKEEVLISEFEVDNFRLMLFSLTSDIIKLLGEVSDDGKKVYITKGYDFCVKIYNYSNIMAMLDWMKSYLTDVISFISQNEVFNVSQIVKQVYKQMQVDYMNDLNLSSVCDKYKINSSYFSKKFKEQIGKNFVDCLTDIRIEVAKGLLINTSYPIKEIGKTVGFNDSKYFSKVFALNLKCTPSSFRAQNRK
jgi:YesN/AraC family two-component response regulator